MPHLICKPGPPLDRYVDVLWYWEGAPTAHHLERLMPDGAQNLVINLHQNVIRSYEPQNPRRFRSLSGAVVTAARAGFEVIDTDCQRRIAGAHFRPGGAYPFLGVPADALDEYDVDVETLWTGDERYLREQMLEAPHPGAALRVLERHLLARLRIGGHPVVPFALAALERAAPVAAVAERAGLSVRRFIHCFRREVGLTPKTYARVCRFQQVVRHLHRRDEVNWAELALECGYYDQAHFIHDFRRFSGFTPTAFLAQPRASVNHVPLPES